VDEAKRAEGRRRVRGFRDTKTQSENLVVGAISRKKEIRV